jgi:hypothetical protein
MCWYSLYNVRKVPKSNRKIIEKGKNDTPNTQIHDRSLSWLGTGTSKKKVVGLTSFMGSNLLS